MASEIHKKRTGKSFRITEEIVLKEEMYEEEDDIYIRSYRRLGSNMQTSSADMNSRAEAFVNSKAAMSGLVARTDEEWRENEINKLFAQSFGNISGRAAQVSPPVVPQQNTQPNMNISPNSPHQVGFPPVNFPPPPAPAPGPASVPAPQAAVEFPFAATQPLGPLDMALQQQQHPADMMQRHPSHGESPIEFDPRQTSAFTPHMSPEDYLLTPGPEMDRLLNPQLQDWVVADALFNPREAAAKFGDVINADFPPAAMPMGLMGDGMGSVEDQPQWDAFINDSAWTQE